MISFNNTYASDAITMKAGPWFRMVFHVDITN